MEIVLATGITTFLRPWPSLLTDSTTTRPSSRILAGQGRSAIRHRAYVIQGVAQVHHQQIADIGLVLGNKNGGGNGPIVGCAAGFLPKPD